MSFLLRHNTATPKSLAFKNIPKDYNVLIRLFPLRPIHDRIDLTNATEMADALAGHGLSPDQEDYFTVLVTLMVSYEQAHVPQPRRKHDPMGNLEFLMEQHKMNASDLRRLLGQRELGSKLLRGERDLSKANICKLAEHFHVSPACFLKERYFFSSAITFCKSSHTLRRFSSVYCRSRNAGW